MPALNISDIKDAKFGSTNLSAVYKGCSQIWRSDNVITQPHSLIQKVPSGAGGAYQYLFYTYLDIYDLDTATNTFEVQFFIDDEWMLQRSPFGARSSALHNGVTYYRYRVYSPTTHPEGPYAFRVRLRTAPQCWSGMNADGSMMPDYPYPQIWTVFSLEESDLEDG